MKSLTEIQENYLAIDFFLSMSCNKDCHYCTSYTLEMRNLTVDMNFLRQTLEYLKEYKDKINLNRWMVLNGHAVAYRKYSKKFVAQENLAKKEKLGLWSGTFQMPWEWRKNN